MEEIGFAVLVAVIAWTVVLIVTSAQEWMKRR